MSANQDAMDEFEALCDSHSQYYLWVWTDESGGSPMVSVVVGLDDALGEVKTLLERKEVIGVMIAKDAHGHTNITARHSQD